MPFAPFTPLAIRFLYVGMAPSAAYFCIRSGLIPSEEKRTTRWASGDGGLAAWDLLGPVRPGPIATTKTSECSQTS
jgi:hypothetical protein